MKETWELIQETVSKSGLNEQEQKSVLDKLDHMMGSNQLEYKYPIESKGLAESETIIYQDIVNALNQAKNLPLVESKGQYVKVLESIRSSKKMSRDLIKLTIETNTAVEKEDWNLVNELLERLENV